MSDTPFITPPKELFGFMNMFTFFTDNSGFGNNNFPEVSKKQSFLDDYNIFKYIFNSIHFNLVLKLLIVIIPLYLFIYYNRGDLRVIFNTTKTFLHVDTAVNRTTLLDGVKRNIFIVLLPFILAILIFMAARDTESLKNNTSNYVLVIFVILFGSFIAFSSLLKFENMSSYMTMVFCAILLLGIVIVKYVSSYITPRVVSIISHVLRLIIVLMIIIGLAIGYKFYSEKLKAITGWQGFFINFLFYIPCLISDGIEYLLQQYNITPNIVFVLLIIELLLALSYFYLPKLLQKSIKKTEIVLLNKPVYLNKETIVGNTEMFLFKPFSDKIEYVDQKALYRRNYCISMWVFLNVHSSSNTSYKYETDIFDYSSHPRITYKNESDNKMSKDKGIYTFYFSNIESKTTSEPDAKYEVSIPNQKWNLISLNYFDTKVDLYINGNLERTYNFSDNIPQYSPDDLVKLGKDNGLNGAICNVSYNKKPLSSTEISTAYNINYMNNPPISFIE
jgi:hypothetical protein